MGKLTVTLGPSQVEEHDIEGPVMLEEVGDDLVAFNGRDRQILVNRNAAMIEFEPTPEEQRKAYRQDWLNDQFAGIRKRLDRLEDRDRPKVDVHQHFTDGPADPAAETVTGFAGRNFELRSRRGWLRLFRRT